jgi:hypothetical protein
VDIALAYSAVAGDSDKELDNRTARPNQRKLNHSMGRQGESSPASGERLKNLSPGLKKGLALLFR